MADECCEFPAHHSAAPVPQGRARLPRRNALRLPGPLSLALVALGSLFSAGAVWAQQHFTVELQAGQTYPLTDLDGATRPHVAYAGNRHAFILECPVPGNCYLLGAEAGQGSVRAVSTMGSPVVYDVTVSALARPGHPLEPGVAPRALRDPSTDPRDSLKDGVKSLAANSEPSAVSSPGDYSASAASAPQAQLAPPPQKYARNPAAKELEIPRSIGVGAPNAHLGTLALMAGSSRLINFAVPLRRVAIADTAVADVQVIGPNQIMVVGHQPGFTTLVTWDDYGNYRERVVRIDRGGPQEVQLNVVVAELNRSKLEQQGIDVAVTFSNAGVSWVGLPGGVATPYNPTINLLATGGAGTIVSLPPSGVLPNAGTLIPLLLSSSLTYGVATQNGQVSTNTFIQLLEQHDLARILAEPHLIAESGQEAKFLSGGEIPIVIAQALNTSIVFKQFGTSVNFVPTVIDGNQGEIELEVSPEFSEPDYTQGVQLFGFTVPAFVTRRAETRVRLRENQTLIIAGLILDTNRSELRKVPYLGDIPFLGAFFRHTYWNHVKSELIMTVTPQIVEPIPAGAQVALPIERGQMTPEEVRTGALSQPDVTRPRLP